MILANPRGFNYHHGNVAPAQALLLLLKASKRAYGLTILRPLIRFYALPRYCDDKIRKDSLESNGIKLFPPLPH